MFGFTRYQWTVLLAARRASARRERTNPPPMIKKVSFCNAAETTGGGLPEIGDDRAAAPAAKPGGAGPAGQAGKRER